MNIRAAEGKEAVVEVSRHRHLSAFWDRTLLIWASLAILLSAYQLFNVGGYLTDGDNLWGVPRAIGQAIGINFNPCLSG